MLYEKLAVFESECENKNPYKQVELHTTWKWETLRRMVWVYGLVKFGEKQKEYFSQLENWGFITRSINKLQMCG